jgi:hypothetical protein
MINLVFEMFTAILFARNQLAIFWISIFTWDMRLARLESAAVHEVSSAKRNDKRLVARGRSLIKHKNRIGPRIVPWSTEMSKFFDSDRWPFISTYCVL